MIYKMIPNVFTLGNLFIGMFAIFLLFDGKPEAAAIAVIVGMLLDGLDGRLARMLNAQSEFGKQLDSLSDLVTFGVAPAVIMFELVLSDLGIAGIIIASIFPMCGALRLARFNVSTSNVGYFVGLPITASGGVLATFAIYADSLSSQWLVAGMLLLSFLMVSNLKYPNYKKLGRSKLFYTFLAIFVVIFAVVAFFYPENFPKLIFVPLALYAFYGIQREIRFFRKKSEADKPAENNLKM